MSTVQPAGWAAPDAEGRSQGRRFGEVAALYERRRPQYPEGLIADVVAAAGPGRPHLLEVGAGTGKATRMLLAAGARVTAVEPDAEMSSVLRQVCQGADVSVVEGTLEDAADLFAAGSFDGVAAAQSWHWVDQVEGPRLAARLLRPGGVLAAFWNTPADCPDYEALIDVYRERAPHMAPAMAISEWAAEMERRRAALSGTDAFAEPERRDYLWEERYTAVGLAELVQTYSGHRVLSPPVLASVCEGVAAMVEQRGGTVTLGYRTVLLMVRRTG